MKRNVLFLLAVCMTSFFLCKEQNTPAVTTAPPVIIDVRTAQEFAAGHLKSAINIPYDVIGDKITAQVPDKSAAIMVYCRSGRRSGIAKQTLDGLGYTAVTNGGAFDRLKKTMPVEGP